MHRNLFSFISAFVLCFGLGFTAHATPIDAITAGTYTVSDTTIDAGKTAYGLTGTVTIGSNGLMTAADITLNDPALGNPVFDVIGNTGGPAGWNPVADYAYVTTATNAGQLYLSYLTTLNASGDIALCINGSTCNGYQASYGQLYSASAFGYNPVDLHGGALEAADTPGTPGTQGTLPAAVTPEPTTLVLIGTGLLGLAGVIYKRAKYRV